MRIMNYIRKAKEDFQRERTTSKANKLATMKRERVRAQGRAKVSRAYDKEKALTKAAKKETFRRSFTGKALAGAKKLQRKANNRPRVMRDKKKGFSIGSGFGEGINPAFQIGKKKR